VRSVTATNMMFMMPMPPTSWDTPAMAKRAVMVCLVSFLTLAISSIVRTMKSSGSPGYSLWRTRKADAIASATCEVPVAVVADTVTC
jgi:hypothetical protein